MNIHNGNQILVVTSPQLYSESKEMVSRYFYGITVMVWKQGDSVGRKKINHELMSKDWQVCISIYNDYIFSKEELNKIPIVINIHPALPHLRGRGHDVLPLINRDTHHGVTLHLITEDIDAGPIIDVLTEPLPSITSYASFRRSNQLLSLKMLDIFLNHYREIGNEKLKIELTGRASQSSYAWKGNFINSSALRSILINFFSRQPDHPLLDQVPNHLMTSPLD